MFQLIHSNLKSVKIALVADLEDDEIAEKAKSVATFLERLNYVFKGKSITIFQIFHSPT